MTVRTEATRRDALAQLISSNVIVTKLVVYQSMDAFVNRGDVMETMIAVIGVMNEIVSVQTQDSNARMVTVLTGQKLMMGKSTV